MGDLLWPLDSCEKLLDCLCERLSLDRLGERLSLDRLGERLSLDRLREHLSLNRSDDCLPLDLDLDLLEALSLWPVAVWLLLALLEVFFLFGEPSFLASFEGFFFTPSSGNTTDGSSLVCPSFEACSSEGCATSEDCASEGCTAFGDCPTFEDCSFTENCPSFKDFCLLLHPLEVLGLLFLWAFLEGKRLSLRFWCCLYRATSLLLALPGGTFIFSISERRFWISKWLCWS